MHEYLMKVDLHGTNDISFQDGYGKTINVTVPTSALVIYGIQTKTVVFVKVHILANNTDYSFALIQRIEDDSYRIYNIGLKPKLYIKPTEYHIVSKAWKWN